MLRISVRPRDVSSERVMLVLSTIMTVGALCGSVSMLILNNEYATAIFIGFSIVALFSWGFYFLHHHMLIHYKYSEHISAFFAFVLFFYVAIYDPLQYEHIWIFLLFIPFVLVLLSNMHVFKIWIGIYLVLYMGLVFIDPAITETDFLPIISRVLYGIGASAGGFIIMLHMSAEKQNFKNDNRVQMINHVVKVMYTLIPIVERKTQTTRLEIDETSTLLRKLANKFPNEQIKDWEIELLSLLHYVSRIKWPDYMFEKEGQLSQFEFNVIQDHCYMGTELLGEFEEFERVKNAFQLHHERIDGTGYPERKTGEHIPILAQLLSVVECYTAMIKPRSYRAVLSREEAFAEIMKEKGKAFREDVVDALEIVLQLSMNEKRNHFSEGRGTA
ncbi:HD domain-containing protein [Bacillus sp. HMF5848]|uniref:HD-GYP domain-containing protein n=1 Tax=Bacillus sp. HMF5848 TaxID=2495421 RepID=UPI000F789D3A|nr:HD domain-containing phosphohydrolase [Bacillus sp. HMF5848]RSK26424.1 HD domain-containing protein [Bacillus sp. HMF5848]